MGLRVLRGGRRQIGNVNTYVGEFGTVFYDENSGTLRLSDGVTPGGAEITPITIVSTTEPTDAPDGCSRLVLVQVRPLRRDGVVSCPPLHI